MSRKKKKRFVESCPICEREYKRGRWKTRHHIFLKWWYRDGITVLVCSRCHQLEFHKFYPMEFKKVWTPCECVQNWVKFCKSKGKNAYIIYPEICDIEPIY